MPEVGQDGALPRLNYADETATRAGRVNRRHSPVQQAAGPRTPPRTTLHGHRLSIIRAVWIAVTVLVLGLFAASIPVAYVHFRSICTSPECGFYAASNVALEVIYTLGFCGVGAFIFWRKSDDWMALFTSLALVLVGTKILPYLVKPYPVLWLPVTFVGWLGSICFFILLYLFPDGRFVPRWTRVLAAIWVVYMVPWYFLPASPFSGKTWSPLLNALLVLGLLSTLVFAQVYRYVRVSGPVERQQTKWFVFGLTAAITVSAGAGLTDLILSRILPSGVGELSPLYTTTILYWVASLSEVLVPLSIAVAILRYHLWDIDVIINRTLVYGSLSAVLAAVFAITDTLLLPLLVKAVLGEDDPSLNAVISAVIIAVLFEPLRRRIKAGVNRLTDWLAGSHSTSELPR
jgi:hypothetical protein